MSVDCFKWKLTYSIIGSNIGNHVFPQQRYTWFLKKCSLKRFSWSVFWGGDVPPAPAPAFRGSREPGSRSAARNMAVSSNAKAQGAAGSWTKTSHILWKMLYVIQMEYVSFQMFQNVQWNLYLFFIISPRSSLQVYPFLEMLWLVRQDTWLFHNSEYCSINSQPYSIHIHMFIHINILLIYHIQWHSIHIQWYIQLSTIFNNIPYISYVPKCICMELIYKFWLDIWMAILGCMLWSFLTGVPLNSLAKNGRSRI